MSDQEKRVENLIALSRFGLGPKMPVGKSGSAQPDDVRAVLRREIDKGGTRPSDASDLSSSAVAFAAVRTFQMGRAANRRMMTDGVQTPMPQMDGTQDRKDQADGMQSGSQQPQSAPSGSMAEPASPEMQPGTGRRQKQQGMMDEPPLPRRYFLAETKAHLDQALDAETGFTERLTWFWANHFCVSVAKNQFLRAMAGSYVREAIRPHVFSRFSDMLLAVTQHPAMLIYLDNWRSIGPNSPRGAEAKRGLNENHAREILELHTLGVQGGYSQTDVTELARLLTGWTVEEGRRGEQGTFSFRPRQHEPGQKTVLGKTYGKRGRRDGEAALAAIALHPATAKHIALKLARHFVADDPPPGLVARLEKTFVRSKGDLAEVSRALIDAPESFAPQRKKMRMPEEFLVGAMRMLSIHLAPPRFMNLLVNLGQPIWEPPGPNGFPDKADAWLSSEGLKTRLDVAAALGRQAKIELTPSECLEAALGPTASKETVQAVSRAESAAQGFALLLMSPEFQRR